MNNLEEAMKDMVKLLVHLKAKLKVEGIDPVCQNKIVDFLEEFAPEEAKAWMKEGVEFDVFKEMLKEAGFIFEDNEGLGDGTGIWLNLNDTFGFACSDTEQVKDEDLPELLDLFEKYGYCGILWWASKKSGRGWSSFKDINRMISFVENEEKVVKEFPRSMDRAYKKVVYTLGEEGK